MAPISKIEIQENELRRKGDLLNTLLMDRTTKKNIIWGTDSYIQYGKAFTPESRITPELITGEYGKLIQPRAIKEHEEQLRRTKDRAEVFTPLKIVDEMNKIVDWSGDTFPTNSENWQNYVCELKLEIACGEAPFIASRYNPVAHGTLIKLENRVGFLDRKLHVVSRFCDKPKEWLKWARIAFQSAYGYEWQGDNLLIARENLLYTLIDYHKAKFGRRPSLAILQEFAEIISWNVFQMDGTRYVVPMSCRNEVKVTLGEITIFGETPDQVVTHNCEGCLLNDPTKHNGRYVKVMDWSTSKSLKFANLAYPPQGI